jgi:hypothetical protein
VGFTVGTTPAIGSISNKIGEFEGSTTSRLDGVFFLDVQADGTWTLSTA